MGEISTNLMQILEAIRVEIDNALYEIECGRVADAEFALSRLSERLKKSVEYLKEGESG